MSITDSANSLLSGAHFCVSPHFALMFAVIVVVTVVAIVLLATEGEVG